MCAMLVPTVINGWNDHQLGDIVRFGAANADTVCGVNLQPVSLIGRMDGEPDEAGRITISGVIERIECQTDGTIRADAWLPLRYSGPSPSSSNSGPATTSTGSPATSPRGWSPWSWSTATNCTS